MIIVGGTQYEPRKPAWVECPRHKPGDPPSPPVEGKTACCYCGLIFYAKGTPICTITPSGDHYFAPEDLIT